MIFLLYKHECNASIDEKIVDKLGFKTALASVENIGLMLASLDMDNRNFL